MVDWEHCDRPFYTKTTSGVDLEPHVSPHSCEPFPTEKLLDKQKEVVPRAVSLPICQKVLLVGDE